MKRIQILSIFTILMFILSACGEEILTRGTISDSFTGTEVQKFSTKNCANRHFIRPPVDILFVIDNTGSTLQQNFQAMKSEIASTINYVSQEFDYHILVAPLLPGTESINSYPLLLNNTSSIPILSNVNVVSPNNLQFFSNVTGNNAEHGFSRAYDIINANRSNGIFRENANTVVVMISNGDDNESMISIQGNKVSDPAKFQNLKNKLLSLTKKYASSNPVTNPLNAQSFRFLSLVAHSSCNGFKTGTNYRKMSLDVYNFMGYTDDPKLNSYNLCSGNFIDLFTSVNNSIKEVQVGHSYDHWLVSKANMASIQSDDIIVKKIKADQSQVNIPNDPANGFTYLGFKENQNTRFAPTPGEPETGLIVKLNGNAKVTYPECIIANTRTPTEYFGFISLATEPDESTIKVFVRENEIPKNNTNGWSYLGFLETKNIKVSGPGDTPVEPPLNKSGYFIQLHGDAIYTNGESVEVFFKAKKLN